MLHPRIKFRILEFQTHTFLGLNPGSINQKWQKRIPAVYQPGSIRQKRGRNGNMAEMEPWQRWNHGRDGTVEVAELLLVKEVGLGLVERSLG